MVDYQGHTALAETSWSRTTRQRLGVSPQHHPTPTALGEPTFLLASPALLFPLPPPLLPSRQISANHIRMSRYTPIGSADGSSRGVAGFSSSSYPPRRSAPATSSREMDAAFDGSDGSDEDDSDDDDTPLARRSPGNGDRTSPGSSGNASRANVGGSSRVLFDAFDEDEARRQGGDESGSFLLPDVDNPLRTQGIVAGSSSSPLAAAAGPEGASYDFDRDYVSVSVSSPLRTLTMTREGGKRGNDVKEARKGRGRHRSRLSLACFQSCCCCRETSRGEVPSFLFLEGMARLSLPTLECKSWLTLDLNLAERRAGRQ